MAKGIMAPCPARRREMICCHKATNVLLWGAMLPVPPEQQATYMLKYYHHTAVSQINLDDDAGLSYFQLRQVLHALNELSLHAAVIRASNTSIGRYVRVAKEATPGLFDVQIWIVDPSLDVLAPFYYGNTGPDEVRRARSCLAALKASGLSEMLVASIDEYLATTDPKLHGKIFNSAPASSRRPKNVDTVTAPSPKPRKVGHLTVVK
ncbi:hypothetical protein ABIB42_001891 [Massilia sp. UYP32]|uniref:hypothetical protein n=1 Tax=Massilia sp. UYP32 TaxID=1756386 RepID=UPI003D1B6E6D